MSCWTESLQIVCTIALCSDWRTKWCTVCKRHALDNVRKVRSLANSDTWLHYDIDHLAEFSPFLDFVWKFVLFLLLTTLQTQVRINYCDLYGFLKFGLKESCVDIDFTARGCRANEQFLTLYASRLGPIFCKQFPLQNLCMCSEEVSECRIHPHKSIILSTEPALRNRNECRVRLIQSICQE